MTKFFKAIKNGDLKAITHLLENEEIDIDENILDGSSRKSTGHCLEHAIGNPDLFLFLLRNGANPLCSITAITKNPPYLESVLVAGIFGDNGVGLKSPLFPFAAKRLSSLRGKEKTRMHHLLLKYDFPVPRDGVWCNQTREECINNNNAIGLRSRK